MTAQAKSDIEDIRQYRLDCIQMICDILPETDKGLRRVCDAIRKDNPKFPAARTIRVWMQEEDDLGRELHSLYARAKDMQLQHIADQIIDISDDSSEDEIFTEDGRRLCNNEFVQRSKLRVDSRKWVLSKLVPRIYGDNQRIEHDIGDNLAEQMRLARERVKQLPIPQASEQIPQDVIIDAEEDSDA